MPNERRRYLRYRMRDNVFAAVTGPDVIVGKVRDLSMGGAALEFIAESSGQSPATWHGRIDIFMLGSTEGLSSILCSVSIREQAARSVSGTDRWGSRICVAEFADLPQPQARAVLEFIMRYNVGYAA